MNTDIAITDNSKFLEWRALIKAIVHLALSLQLPQYAKALFKRYNEWKKRTMPNRDDMFDTGGSASETFNVCVLS
jgi:hypothetical protein